MASNVFYVYAHSVDGHIFYIGYGRFERVTNKDRRNLRWNSIVSRANNIFDVGILGKFAERQEARDFESEMIAKHKPPANIQRPFSRKEFTRWLLGK